MKTSPAFLIGNSSLAIGIVFLIIGASNKPTLMAVGIVFIGVSIAYRFSRKYPNGLKSVTGN